MEIMLLYNLPLIVEANILTINLSSALFYLHWLTQIIISFLLMLAAKAEYLTEVFSKIVCFIKKLNREI